jgi:hypothetical protein
MKKGSSHLHVDAIAELVERGVAPWRIAHRTGLTMSQVRYRLRVENLDPYIRNPLPPVPESPIIHKRGDGIVRRFTAADDAQLLALDAQGLSVAEIARRMGRRDNSIHGRLECLARRAAREEFQQGVSA